MNNIPEPEAAERNRKEDEFAARCRAQDHRSALAEAARLSRVAMAWHMAALSAGLYRGDEDVSTPEKWLSAQLRAYKRLKVPPFDRDGVC